MLSIYECLNYSDLNKKPTGHRGWCMYKCYKGWSMYKRYGTQSVNYDECHATLLSLYSLSRLMYFHKCVHFNFITLFCSCGKTSFSSYIY